jgi:hypothetical protein
MPELHQTNGEPVNPEVHHERTDVNIRGVLWFVVGLGGLGLLVHFVIGGIFSGFKGREERVKPPLPPAIERERRQQTRGLITPPAGDQRRLDFPEPDKDQEWQPRLETTELEDIESLRAAEEKYLQSYGVVNRKKGVYRIPIGRAMELLADPKAARANGIRVRKKGGGGGDE